MTGPSEGAPRDLSREDCLEYHQGGCEGPVQWRESLSGTGVPMKRCRVHHLAALHRRAEIDRKYAPFSDVPPEDFDPTYAGERWSDDY